MATQKKIATVPAASSASVRVEATLISKQASRQRHR
jgi:hypothetical protein